MSEDVGGSAGGDSGGGDSGGSRQGGGAAGLSLRPAFVRQVSAAADALGIGITWHSDHWIATLTRDGAIRRIIGYSFPLNDASAAQIANDKVATYVMLAEHGVPAVPHRILRFPPVPPPRWPGLEGGQERLPVVVKPHKESGGIDVHRASTPAELAAVLGALARRYRAVTLSPYLEIESEYRVIVLDDEAKLIYAKVRSAAQPDPLVRAAPGPAEWRHNLRLGARPEVVSGESQTRELATIARRAMAALGLRFASVDVVRAAGDLRVLEVNSAVTLEHFSRCLPEYERCAADVYLAAIGRCFEPSAPSRAASSSAASPFPSSSSPDPRPFRYAIRRPTGPRWSTSAR